MTQFYRGIAGKRPGKPKGAVIHNDAGSQYATVAFYKQWLNSTRDAENGFAQVYISSDGRYQLEDYDNMAWHTASTEGNTWYVGWEADQSMGDQGVFMRNEAAVLKDVASFMKQYGLTPNRQTVRLHQEFSSTTCPHRSWELHGQALNVVKDYFIAEIKKYMSGSNTSEKPSQSKQEEEATMVCLYLRPRKGGADYYYFNGIECVYCPHMDNVKILKEIYKANNGKDMPVFTWTKTGEPWYQRLEQVAPIKK